MCPTATRLAKITNSTGLSAELHRIEAEDLPKADSTGRIDVGVIDLRQEPARHRTVLRAAAEAPPGKVRFTMFFAPPYTGPNGEPVSLGSRQFPDRVLGSEVEWLLPLDAESVYFLVEHPLDSGSGDQPERRGNWRSSRQQLFGPFTSTTLPTELILD